MIKGLVCLLLVIAVLPLTSAVISLEQPKEFYNIGEELSFDLTLTPSSAANDFLEVSIGCGNETVQIYRNPFNLAAGKQVIIGVIVVLDQSLIGDMKGECVISAEYANDMAVSQSFQISDKIDIDIDLEVTRYNPGDNVLIKGTALRQSGNPVVGFLEARIVSLGILDTKNVKEGKFFFNISIPEKAATGKHNLEVRVFEETVGGNTGNSGNLTKIIEINPVLAGLEIIIDSLSVSPGGEIEYIVNANDQANNIFNKEISLKIFEPGEIVFLEKIIKSGEKNIFKLDDDFSPGYWKFEASVEKFKARKLIYVDEFEKIQTSLINRTLIVTNVGNVPFMGPIEISIGSSTQIKQIDIGVGESQKYLIYAPDGTYLIGVNDGKENLALGNAYLTGNTIRIEDLRVGFLDGVTQPVIWLFALIILIIIIVYVQKQRSKIRKSKSAQKEDKIGKSYEKAIPSNVMYGKKQDANIVALRIGRGSTNSYSDASIDRALMIAKRSGAKVYLDGDYRISLFSPSLTKVGHNDVLSVKIGNRMADVLNEHNKRSKIKVNFGIGIHRGQIISEIRGNEFRFTTVGKFMTKVKRIAQDLDREALLSDEIRRAVVNEVKTEKVGGKEAWRIIKISDRESHSSFLGKFSHHDKDKVKKK